jgi:hypothetical protein
MFFSGKDYPHLCSLCRKAVDDMHQLYTEGLTEDEDNDEAPCDAVYDRRMFCGGHTCVNKVGDTND